MLTIFRATDSQSLSARRANTTLQIAGQARIVDTVFLTASSHSPKEICTLSLREQSTTVSRLVLNHPRLKFASTPITKQPSKHVSTWRICCAVETMQNAFFT